MMPDWEKDAAAGKLILERAGLEVFHSPLHLEGGSIHTDGEGCDPETRCALRWQLITACPCWRCVRCAQAGNRSQSDVIRDGEAAVYGASRRSCARLWCAGQWW